MADRRDLTVGIDGDPKGFDRACKSAEDSARAFDRELTKVDVQMAATERTTARAAQLVDSYAKSNDKAALSAARLGVAAKEGADKAASASVKAAEAAKKLERGEIDAAAAAQLEARAEREVEKAAIAAAAAQLAAARAADEQAKQERQVARDAELAGAAQRLAAYKASGSVREHNAALKALEARFGDLSKEGGGAFKSIEQSSSSAFSVIGSTGPGAIALVAAAIMAIPFAAIGVESAITLGIGGALGGLGLMATKSDAQVQAALHGMTGHIKSETKQMAAPFKDTWMVIAAEGRKTFDALAPELKKDFAVLAPAFTRFAHDAGYSITLLAPAFHAATASANTLLGALGPKLPEITRSLGKAITIMADSAAAHAGDFANLASSIAGLLPPIAHVIDWAIKLGPVLSPLYGVMAKGGASVSALHDGFVKLSGGLISSQHGLTVVSQTFPTFAQQAGIAAAGAGQLMTAQQAATLTTDQLKTALDRLTGANQNSFDATTNYRMALAAANAQAKSNNAGIDGMGKAATTNRQSLSSLAKTIKDLENSGHHSAAEIENMRQKLISAAQGMGVSRAAAVALANNLLGIKAPPPIKLSMDDADFMAKLHAAKGLKIDPKTGRLLGNGSDYYNKWLTAKGLKIDPKTGLLRGNNADYYNKWLAANHLKIDPKTGQIKGNTKSFWDSINAIPPVVGHRTISVGYAPAASANQPGSTRHADGGIDRYAAGGVRRDLPPHIQTAPTVLYGEPETGGEAYIPLGSQKRARSTVLLGDVAHMFGLAVVKPMAEGGIEVFADGGSPTGSAAFAPVPTTTVDVGSLLSQWQQAVQPATKAQVDAAAKARRTQVDQLASARGALRRAEAQPTRTHAERIRRAEAIAAAERRIAKERRDLADATTKLHGVERRYQAGRQTPAQQFGSALALGIKNSGAFIHNLEVLADRGFGQLAQQLLSTGGPEAEKIAASAVKMTNKQLTGLQGQLKQAQQQQDTLTHLPQILALKSAIKGGASTWDSLLTATGLSPNDLAATLKLMSAELSKTPTGRALLDQLKARGYAQGGPIVGPAGVDRVPLWGTAGEYVVKAGPAAANRQYLDAINRGSAVHAPAALPVRGGDGASVLAPITIHAPEGRSALAVAKETSYELGWALKMGGSR